MSSWGIAMFYWDFVVHIGIWLLMIATVGVGGVYIQLALLPNTYTRNYRLKFFGLWIFIFLAVLFIGLVKGRNDFVAEIYGQRSDCEWFNPQSEEACRIRREKLERLFAAPENDAHYENEVWRDLDGGY